MQVLYLDGRDANSNRVDDYFQRHTIIHEWGHHLMNWYYTENGGNIPQGDCNPIVSTNPTVRLYVNPNPVLCNLRGIA